MSEQYKTMPVQSAPLVREFNHEPDHQRRHAAQTYANQAPKARIEREDVAEFLGLVPSEISDHLKDALIPLLQEYERLRQAEALSLRRVLYLEDQADRHHFLDCLNRHAFIRDLDVFLSGGDVGGALAVVHVAGVEIRRARLGLMAADAAMKDILTTLKETVESADLLASLGGSDFAILFPACTTDYVSEKLTPVMTRLENMGFGPRLGIVEITSGQSAMQLILAADQARLAAG